MARLLRAVLFITGLVLLVQCKKDDDQLFLKLTVKDYRGHTVPGIRVYIFDTPTFSSANEPGKAKHSGVTNEEGVATFLLNELFESEPIYRQTLVSLIAFDRDKQEIGRTQVLITEGKNAEGTMVLGNGYENISSL